jgi:small acid-soluble spore protein F (minor alpha/beta-type SASP)
MRVGQGGYILARKRGIMSEQLKYEIARELGVDQIVASQGWGAVTSRDCGNMVSKAIQLAEKSLTKV